MSPAAPLHPPRPGPVRVDGSPFAPSVAPSVAPAARPAPPAFAREPSRTRSPTLPQQVSLLSLVARTATPTPGQEWLQIAAIPIRDEATAQPGPTPPTPTREPSRTRSPTLPQQVSLLSLVARTATPTPRQEWPQIAAIPIRDEATAQQPGPTPGELLALWRSIQPVANALAVLAALVLFIALALAVVPQAFGMETLVVNGGSMGSSVRNGSIVVARWIDAEDVEPGDVIVVRRPTEAGYDSRIMHRVVAVERGDGETVIRTKGDANSTEDPGSYVLPPRVPTPLYVIPFLGYAVALVGTPLGWTLLIGVPGLVLCILTLHSIWATESHPTAGPRRSARHEAAAA